MTKTFLTLYKYGPKLDCDLPVVWTDADKRVALVRRVVGQNPVKELATMDLDVDPRFPDDLRSGWKSCAERLGAMLATGLGAAFGGR